MGTISITFDSDHMSENSMQAFLAGVDIPGAATFFCTHRYECLSAQQDTHEVAIHPVLDNTTQWGDFSDALRNDCGADIVVGARAHSLAYKQQYGGWLADHGFSYVSQTSLYYQSRITPYWHPWGLWEMPIYFQDNSDMDMAKTVPGFEFLNEAWLTKAIEGEGLYVFAFHPVHIMLNTFDVSTYGDWRKAGNPDLVEFDKPEQKGIGNYFEKLLTLMKAANIDSTPLRDLAVGAPTVEDWIAR